jgi:endonuclease/exonuclease/phosphatase family metal-dependent hydrolase
MKSFEILQYNAHKAWPVMATFLRDKTVVAMDIIAVQEPWKNGNQHTTHQPATATFQLLYPAQPASRGQQTTPPQPGVCLFVSKKIDAATWSCQLISQDYQLLKLRRAHIGKDWTDLFVHNVYDRPGSNTLAQLRGELAKRPLAEHVILGDMNAHHPAWGGIGTKVDDEAEQLLEIMDAHDLDLTTEEGKVTWTRNDQSSVIDLTFISSSLSSRLIRCERADDVEHSSDHFPVRTVFDIETPIRVQEKRRNWNATDYDKLTHKIEEGLQARDLSQTDPTQIECQCQTLVDVVQSAIDSSTPWAHSSVWSNPDFDHECKAAVREVRRLRRKHTRTKDPYDWMRYSEARNKKTRLIKKALSRAHRRRVQ